jgi:hypothetical protein
MDEPDDAIDQMEKGSKASKSLHDSSPCHLTE